ncbi:hypothetical protein [Streptomyces sp. LBL]|uniref:hypothetical protein n=1 Tax=Streptomyces sp. LBL TaxID=2940562 RepID=UPI002474C707|nr:hypothetical protein [Streptomyces sp. LBL]
MGSLRNPVGPLPSTIYWRRRVVLASVVALLALLIAWIVASDGGGGKNGADGPNDKNPSPTTITPGPSGSGPAISQAPGGRDESSGSDSGGSGSGGGTGDGSGGGSGSSAGSGSGGSSGSEGSGGGAAGGAGVGVSTGDTLPAGSTLPDCTAGAVKLTVRSLHNAYGPNDTPALLVTATNSSGDECKVDLGPKKAVLTITQAGSEDDYWSSADCPKVSGSLVFRVAAGSSITYPVKWDRKPSAPQCATPSAKAAGAGTYLVEAKTPGFGTVQTSFVLEND